MTNFFVAFVFAWSVIDGDTIKVNAMVWPNVATQEERVRLVRIDAPELHGGPPCEHELALKATDWTRARLAAAKRIEVRAGVNADALGLTARDSFGRILGDVVVDGVSLSDAGLAAGVFRPYVRPKAAWC